MCGICGVVGHRPATPIIFEALRRLEYRGYDSAGIATLSENGVIDRRRAAGKLDNLETVLKQSPLSGSTGIGHTRWATHGAPTETNAHPHAAGQVAIVHNGIIENFAALKAELEAKGRRFVTETDSETVAHLLDNYIEQGMAPREAAFATIGRLEGAYAIAMIFQNHDGLLIGARHGAPLAVGYGEGEMFLGSDSLALAPLANRISYLEDGDWCELTREGATIFNAKGDTVQRQIQTIAFMAGQVGKDGYRHYMEKELHEHPVAIGQTLQRITDPASKRIALPDMPFDIAKVPRITITACGSAFYAGMVGRYWLESLARIPVEIDVASELRYRDPPQPDRGVALLISQSGETADTLGVLRSLKKAGQSIVSVLNVEHSTMGRESDLVLGMVAGPEISVASTKAFTAQLSVLAAFSIDFARARGKIDQAKEEALTSSLLDLPSRAAEVFACTPAIQAMAAVVAEARDVLYLGRGICTPIAYEGALKLKEISYIHAEAYAAGELKHGPISLIDRTVPVVAIVPSNILFEKTLSNLQEAKARGGRVLAFTDAAGAERLKGVAEHVVVLPDVDAFVVPILYAIPVQMLAYEVALLKGTDVDQPRNLAKSVTVE
ncbi:glutamine--fructose-6-phosphate transaminase (isomerizing) [Gluconobacter wancherniae]|uniref:Glutamine--fructose-6-phosphate aminotransferase [isomerizing] n=1 Tax=Gluconobacter wancherniae NBRC 103581 TaxID=656744 RepID=A0A511B0S4_9PROT|nr:glutamine--fructose-6-phosphate transaminase (isomerizing) [Gluconobacter wancherniae]MBF0853562.1 glutamine--fructose-6-phosphate transaminase (isomerizing) [Gluconobacter wancherniae]GBD55692.1 glutamine--fructose-6-phosphate aminotransferase [isomerizing] [Gluconobacter wancherniae NBRC 103581]GBR66290.1 glucosamine--fructose-6-phosphate aminotransferase [Gluconobacter wancherniae NBRC 103581]GEK93402.1 glutamine--fructose-6-phosphate aminotransferase [isomerizing] [Gluconobacter wanchern